MIPFPTCRKVFAALAMASVVLFCVIVSSGVRVHPDTVRDLFLARECLQSGSCALSGALTSLTYLPQGGAWILHLAAAEALGIPLEVVQKGTAILLAASIGLLFLLARRVTRTSTAFLATAAFLVMLLACYEPQVAWNPSLVPLPAVLLLACALHTARTRALTPFLGMALCWAFLVQLHPSAVAFLPFLVVVTASQPPARAWLAVPLALAVALVSLAGISRDAMAAPFLALAFGGPTAAPGVHGSAILAAAATVVFVVVWVALVLTVSRRLRPGAEAALGWQLGVGPLGLVVIPAALLGHPMQGYYLLPFLPGLALVVARGAERIAAWGRGWGRALAIAGGVVATLQVSVTLTRSLGRDDTQPCSFRDVRQVAAGLARLGVHDYDSAFQRLQGPRLECLLAGLQVVPFPVGTAPVGGEEAPLRVQVLQVSRQATTESPSSIGLPMDGGGSLVLRAGSGALDWTAARIAVVAPDGSRLDQVGRRPAPLAWDTAGYLTLECCVNTSSFVRVEATVPVTLQGGAPMELRPCPSGAVDRFQLESVDAEGIEAGPARDTGWIRLSPGPGGAEGHLRMTWLATHPGGQPGPFIPGVIERPIPTGSTRDDVLEEAADACPGWDLLKAHAGSGAPLAANPLAPVLVPPEGRNGETRAAVPWPPHGQLWPVPTAFSIGLHLLHLLAIGGLGLACAREAVRSRGSG